MRAFSSRRFSKILAPFFLFAATSASCGINTEQPLFPLFTFSVIGAPSIVNVQPRETLTPDLRIKMEFDLEYYVTNSEEGFLGYNLYIQTSTSAAETQVTGIGVPPYLPHGIQPSFSHVGEVPDTKNLVTKRITHQTPPPGEIPFDLCEKYFFRMTAITRAGTQSPPSAEKSVCAARDPLLCPKGSVCNP